MWTREAALWKRGIRRIVGVDEAGRGPLAGPVVAAAVILPAPGDPGYRKARRALAGVRDSKQLSERARRECVAAIKAHALAWGLGERGVAEIDRLNILRAALEAMRDAVAELPADSCSLAPEYVLVDGNFPIPELDVGQETIVGGDACCVSIAAASILAKVHRDALMAELHDRHPAYGFDRHKGYPTAGHLATLAAHGPCEAHRRTFRPVSDMLARQLSL